MVLNLLGSALLSSLWCASLRRCRKVALVLIGAGCFFRVDVRLLSSRQAFAFVLLMSGQFRIVSVVRCLPIRVYCQGMVVPYVLDELNVGADLLTCRLLVFRPALQLHVTFVYNSYVPAGAGCPQVEFVLLPSLFAPVSSGSQCRPCA